MFHGIFCKITHSEQRYRNCFNGSFPKTMCQFEALLTTDFNDENKYNTKAIYGRGECQMLFFLCIHRIFFTDNQSVSLVQKE